jgi:spore maturation protein CgeB
MRIVYFTQSIISDWNNGNAHFLRGIISELISRGIEVKVKEPIDGWSLSNLKQFYGDKVVKNFYENFPMLSSEFYNPQKFIPEEEIGEAQLVIVHEWNEPAIIKKIG